MSLILKSKLKIAVIITCLLLLICCARNRKKIVLPEYTVYKSTIKTDDPENELFLRIIVSDTIKEEQLKALLDTLYKEKKQNPGGGDPLKETDVRIFAYTSEKHAMEPDLSWYGRIEMIGDYLANYVLDSIPPEPEIRFGLTPSKRKEVYREYNAVSHKATLEANEKYPNNVKKQYKHADMLTKKYRSEIMKEHELDEEQFLGIIEEVLKKK